MWCSCCLIGKLDFFLIVWDFLVYFFGNVLLFCCFEFFGFWFLFFRRVVLKMDCVGCARAREVVGCFLFFCFGRRWRFQ